MSCPGGEPACTGHGQCLSMAQLAEQSTDHSNGALTVLTAALARFVVAIGPARAQPTAALPPPLTRHPARRRSANFVAMADEAPKAGKSRNSNRRISFNDQATVVAATAAAEESRGTSSEDVLKAKVDAAYAEATAKGDAFDTAALSAALCSVVGGEAAIADPKWGAPVRFGSAVLPS